MAARASIRPRRNVTGRKRRHPEKSVVITAMIPVALNRQILEFCPSAVCPHPAEQRLHRFVFRELHAQMIVRIPVTVFCRLLDQYGQTARMVNMHVGNKHGGKTGSGKPPAHKMRIGRLSGVNQVTAPPRLHQCGGLITGHCRISVTRSQCCNFHNTPYYFTTSARTS